MEGSGGDGHEWDPGYSGGVYVARNHGKTRRRVTGLWKGEDVR